MDIDQGPPTSVTRNLMTSDGPGFKIDTVTYDKIPAEYARKILSLEEPTSVVTDKSKRSFRVKELFKLEKQMINCFQLPAIPPRRFMISHLKSM